jgi:predicted permease
VSNLLQDLRHGVRMALRSPGFTLVAVFTLAIGIAANTTVFNWLDMMMLRPIPGAAHVRELVAFEEVAPDGKELATSWQDFRDYRDRLHLVSGLMVSIPGVLNIGEGDHAERVWAEAVSGNAFAVLGVRPALGRVFSREEYGDKLGAFPVVVIGYSLWQRRFNGDPKAIGSKMLVNGQPMTIIGVAPAEFRGSLPAVFLELWVPLTMDVQLGVHPAAELLDRNTRMMVAVARLAPGVSIEQGRAECASMARRLAEENPRTNGGIGATLLPIRKGHFGGQTTMEGPLYILMAACGVILLIVCANVANLLLARATSRRKEFSLRLAMGAGRARLMRHLLVESLVLAVLGVAVGIPLAMWMNLSLEYLMPRGARIPVSFDIPLSGDILLFNLIVCVAACLVSGIAPALQATRANLNEVLKEGGRSGSEGARSQRLRGVLVAAEVAMALVAVVAAGLFAKSFDVARHIEPGFEPRGVLISHVDTSGTRYSNLERRLFFERLGRKVAAQPGVSGVSWSNVVPLWFFGGPIVDAQVEGYVRRPNESMKISLSQVSPGYFDVMKIPLLEGRDFTDHDTETTQPVMIVNRTFAGRFFPGGSAIGHRVFALREWYTVVGVVRDIKYVKPTEAATPYFYVPVRQTADAQMLILHIRTTGDPERLVPMVRREVAAADPAVRLFDAMSLTESITAGVFGQRMAAALLAGMGLFALALAATGLYSVMAYSVAQRTQEIGIRMALGAKPADVLRMVVRSGMRLTLIGVAIGVVVALALMRLAASLLVHVSASDPLVFIGATLFLAAVALAASYLPALRATRIDPNDALRCE